MCIGQALFENLFLNGIQLVTKVKNNMRNSLMSIADKILLKKKAWFKLLNENLKKTHKKRKPKTALPQFITPPPRGWRGHHLF